MRADYFHACKRLSSVHFAYHWRNLLVRCNQHWTIIIDWSVIGWISYSAHSWQCKCAREFFLSLYMQCIFCRMHGACYFAHLRDSNSPIRVQCTGERVYLSKSKLGLWTQRYLSSQLLSEKPSGGRKFSLDLEYNCMLCILRKQPETNRTIQKKKTFTQM